MMKRSIYTIIVFTAVADGDSNDVETFYLHSDHVHICIR